MKARFWKTCSAGVLGVVLLLGYGGVILAETTAADVEQALQALSLSQGEKILEAFKIGFVQGHLLPEETLRLVTRLTVAEGSPAEKEAILLTLASALMDDLPGKILVDKTLEGLSRGVPLSQIGQQVSIRARLLVEVRDLLYSKGILVATEGQAASSFLLPARFDLLVIHIADALGEYLEGGGSPLDGFLLEEVVHLRLSKLEGVVIPVDDVELVLARITAGDLSRVVLEVLDWPSERTKSLSE